ncbi:DNA polymerase delta subunit 3, partial [Merops nubicus]
VTYKWLSYTLGVHVNQAKQMLYDYVERKRKENSGAQLHVTYLVAGNLVQNGHMCHKVAVVREDKLEAMKSKLATLASVHVYSIQKALLKDSGPLYNTDYDIIKSNLHNCTNFDALTFLFEPQNSSVERVGRDLWRSSPPTPLLQQASHSKVPRITSRQVWDLSRAGDSTASLGSLLQAQPPSHQRSFSSCSASSKPPAKGNIMNNFFGKAAMNKLKVNSVPEQPKEEKEVVKPSVPVAEPESSSNSVAEKPGKKAESVRIQQKDKKSKMKRMDKSDNEEERDPESQKKKRKRIKQLESDSSDEEGVPPPPTPEEEKAPSPPPAPALKTELEPVATEVSAGGRKRKRKRVLKSKMFIDEEEGCMVTEKVYESESCTDSEDDFAKSKPPAPHKQPPLPVKKEPKEERKNLKKGAAAANRANKQVSIMGFFQKK